MIQFPHLPVAYPLAGTKGLSPWWEKTKLCTALWNRFFLSHRHSFTARSCKTAKCSMNTLSPAPGRWLCPSAWPEIQEERKKTSLQFLSKRGPNSSYGKAELTVNKKKLKTAMWTALLYRCGLGPARAKLNASGVESGATLTKKNRLAENVIWVALTQRNLFLSGKGTPCWPRCWTPSLGPAPDSLQISLDKAGKGQRALAEQVPCKAHNGSKRSRHSSHRPKPQSLSSHGSVQSDKFQAGWKEWIWPWLLFCL